MLSQTNFLETPLFFDNKFSEIFLKIQNKLFSFEKRNDEIGCTLLSQSVCLSVIYLSLTHFWFSTYYRIYCTYIFLCLLSVRLLSVFCLCPSFLYLFSVFSVRLLSVVYVQYVCRLSVVLSFICRSSIGPSSIWQSSICSYVIFHILNISLLSFRRLNVYSIICCQNVLLMSICTYTFSNLFPSVRFLTAFYLSSYLSVFI